MPAEGQLWPSVVDDVDDVDDVVDAVDVVDVVDVVDFVDVGDVVDVVLSQVNLCQFLGGAYHHPFLSLYDFVEFNIQKQIQRTT